MKNCENGKGKIISREEGAGFLCRNGRMIGHKKNGNGVGKKGTRVATSRREGRYIGLRLGEERDAKEATAYS